MKRIIPVLIVFMLFSLAINAQNNFESLWLKVEKLEVDNLPKSALKIVQEIYTKAVKEDNSPQLIKSLFYKSKFSLTLEENAQLKVINQFKKHITESEFPTKNVLENILANLYWQYFNQHRYKFYNRTKTASKVDASDFRTWDLNTLFKEIHCHFEASLENDTELQKTKIYDFAAILQIKKESKNYRPTLYDFLANNALDFYKSSETSITRPSYKFTLDNAAFLGDAKTFSNLTLTTKDRFSLQFNALNIYQNLIKFHLKNQDSQALVAIDLHRIHFVNQHATFKNKEDFLLATLKTSQENYKKNKVSGLYGFEIAKIYNQKAKDYLSNKNEEDRFKNQKAIALCDKIIKKYPKSVGARKSAILKAQILQKKLSLQAEAYLPIAKNARISINYKNIEQLFFTAYKVSNEQIALLNKTYKFEKKLKLIHSFEEVEKWNAKLRNEKDYLQHTTEVLVPKFDRGNYLIIASETKNIEKNKIYGTAGFQATNLTLIENNFDGKYKYQIVDRNTGRPIKNAKIHLKNKNNSKNRYIHKKLTTDKNGFASFKSRNRYSNVSIFVKTNSDEATFGYRYLYKYDKEYYRDAIDEDLILNPYIFTDRSIYRPGQTVYFKAIVIKKQGDVSEVFKNEFIEITLKDVNHQTVKSLDLKLNEFGAVSGEFILPNNGLTGEFSISVEDSSEHASEFYDNADFDFDYNNSETTISVEEYKRPKFETVFEPVTESFKVNDSVTVKGFSKAFSGAQITAAKVRYRVVRKVQYPSWYYWYRPNPNTSSQEITHGESITDEKGGFEITFKALPDETVSKESLPVFYYEITAEVTDLNGETRSATGSVKVGYHSLLASILIENNIDKNSKQNLLRIDTKNLNDEFVAAKGTLKIYKLQAPKNPYRARVWPAPDYQDISEGDFRKLFPNEPYTTAETDEKNWQKGSLVFSKNFDTNTAKKILLESTKKWLSGKYLVILESEDVFGQKVKDEKRIRLFSSKEKQVADNKLFIINTNKTFYKVDDIVSVNIGSASKDITVVVQIEKGHKIIETCLVTLNNETKTITIPVNKNDVGGFAIKYHFVNYNYFKSGNLIINVPEQEESPIEIETTIFRDKVQPGAEETWSFTIKNDKNDKIAAEILASMYDASLDEFKQHNWNFNPISQKRSYNSYRQSTANNSFKKAYFRVKNTQNSSFKYPRINQTSYNWFGFSLKNIRWKNQRYLRETRRKIERQRTDFDGTISGFLKDESGPLPGVSVIIKDTGFGTETDFDGAYSINIKKGDVLVYRYLGYKPEERVIGDLKTIDVEMAADENSVLDEIVVMGYGTQKRKTSSNYFIQTEESEMLATGDLWSPENSTDKFDNDGSIDFLLTDEISKIRLKGDASFKSSFSPLYIIDGNPVSDDFDINSINPSEVINIRVLKNKDAVALYGAKGANGVIIITTKKGQAKTDKALSAVKARKNFKETAFFFPQLKTDKNGQVSFTFTMPEALTRWKLQLLAHTKQLKSATKTLQTVSQKELMVVPNAPRFLREGDKITLSAKITNLTNNRLNGFAKLFLTDVISGKEINAVLGNLNSNKDFSVDKEGNTNVSWNLSIPETVQAIQYKIVAKAGDFSDGEQNIIPVLTNRKLVTETLPMWVRSNQTKIFTLDKLKTNTSSTLKNHKLTLEITSNPVWYALQSLPYLMEYPYECAEQTFSRYYANTLASFVANSNPRIQEVFNSWKSSDALLSNLEKNQELKSLLIQETPWLRDAQSETEQKKRIALLFDLNKMKNEQEKAIHKLQEMQMSSGGFPWFKGGRYENIFITQHIATGFGHLQKLGLPDFDTATKNMIEKAVKFLDGELLDHYDKLLERANEVSARSKNKKVGDTKYKAYLAKNNIGYFAIQYLYMRSFYPGISLDANTQKAVDYYQNQTIRYWNEYNLYAKGQIALSLFRADKKVISKKILKSLKENAITSEALGMYWKSNTAGYYYYQAPVETQALMLETFSEIVDPKIHKDKQKTIDNLKIWLLKNKQTNRWKTTKATTEAVYALLLNGSDWVSITEMVDLKVGGQKIDPTKLEAVKIEAGTGYFKTSWKGTEITPKMSEVTLTKKGNGIAWGSLYWQYFEDLDKITSAETPLKLNKKLFLKLNSDTGKTLKEITHKTPLKVGDLITVRIELRTDREMEFIHMKDMRASGVEPVTVLSKYKWQDNLGYYESTKDAATNFFFDRIPKGMYVFEYDVRVNNAGDFSNGITTIQSMYAPAFRSHSKDIRIKVLNEKK